MKRKRGDDVRRFIPRLLVLSSLRPGGARFRESRLEGKDRSRYTGSTILLNGFCLCNERLLVS